MITRQPSRIAYPGRWFGGKDASMVSLGGIETAAETIRGKIVRTPLILSRSLSRELNADIYLKLENFQVAGSFKARGATHRIITLGDEIGEKGVVAASAGNHAQGVALAAKAAGLPATIVMPEWASITKQESTRRYGGKVILAGRSVEESLEQAQNLAGEGMTFIHPFEDPAIIAGQGTIALEIFERLGDPDIIVSPVGGGGLISGVATAAKSLKRDIRIIGVQARACPSAYASYRKNSIVSVDAQPTIADGIGVRRVGETSFEIMRRHVDEILLVDEEQIAEAMLSLLENEKILVEGAGATPLAALKRGMVEVSRGSKVVLLISGGNVDSPLLGRIIGRGLVKKGRLMHISVVLPDSPGSLSRLLAAIARIEANVLDIHHDRNIRELPIDASRVELVLETRGVPHGEEICRVLRDQGYDIEVT